MNIGEILQKSWKTIWKNKILWLFGILASCAVNRGGGGGGGGNFSGGDWGNNNNNGNNFGGDFPFGSLPPGLENFARSMERAADDGTILIYIGLAIVVLLCVGIILSLVFLALGTIGKIGLVRGTWMTEESGEKLTFAKIWAEVKPHFWRMVLYQIILGLAGFILGILLIIPSIFLVICTCGLGLLVLWLGGWLVRAFVELSVVAIAGEKLGIMEALQRTFKLFKENFWNVALMAVILFIGEFVASLIIGLPVLLVVVPVAIGALAESQTALVTGGIISGVLLLVYIIIAIVLSGIMRSYLGTAWALTFRSLAAVSRPAPVSDPVLTEENPV